MNNEQTIILTKAIIQQTFSEWDRRFREDPDSFENIATHLLQGNHLTYGEEAAEYFLEVFRDVVYAENVANWKCGV